MNELYFWSPYKRGKLFSRFTFKEKINVDSKKIISQLNNYVNYAEFKWTEETQPDSNDEQHISGLINEVINLTIKTNSNANFQIGDIVLLDAPQFGGEKYFTITNSTPDWIKTPAPILLYQHLSLVSLSLIEDEEDDDV